MSYTTIVYVFPNEKVECGEELRNSYGSAPVVWDALCQKYLSFPKYGWVMRSGGLSVLWDLWKNKDIPTHQRAVLMMTFDRAYVSKENYQRAANDIRAFLSDFPVDPEIVNHWPVIAEYFESDPDIPAIGLWCTSVSDNPFHGSWDEEKEEYAPPDWNECRDIYRELSMLEDEHV